MKRLMIRRAILLVAGVLLFCPTALFGANGSHAPIAIASDSDFLTCSCVSGGSGTTTNPYIIGEKYTREEIKRWYTELDVPVQFLVAKLLAHQNVRAATRV